MNVSRTALVDVLLIQPKMFGDARGYFFESYNRRTFKAATGLDVDFVQDNQSRSARNVLRGLHYQIRQAQGKLVRVLSGEIYDVAVDLRRGSAQFGKSVGVRLSSAANQMLWIPPGYAHGFLVISEFADVLYKATDYYAPEYERTLLWSDPELSIRWPLSGDPVLADKDRRGMLLHSAEVFD